MNNYRHVEDRNSRAPKGGRYQRATWGLREENISEGTGVGVWGAGGKAGLILVSDV